MAKEEATKTQKTPEEQNQELRSLIAQIEALRAEVELVNQSIAALRSTQATLATIKDLGKGKSMLIPVGSILQIKAKVEDVENVVIDIGGNLSVELPYAEALEYLDKQLAGLRDQRRLLEEAIAALYARAEELLGEVRGEAK
ncbi:prefoldin subunit alpha [Oceanithermus sp.]|uniref:prefoldin subunit alpha n=1 Tax=Oceanithermus sp. TaxID=2268145 RepID=UPI0025CFDA54|nr:prefoldin subunit alpha [Oceanithermus sp.]